MKAGNQRWRQGPGPAAAAIALLLDVGWEPQSARLRCRPDGRGWMLPEGHDPDAADMDTSAIQQELLQDMSADAEERQPPRAR